MNMEAPNAIDKVRRLAGHTGKMFVVGVLIIVCWIGSLLVMGVINERSDRQSEADMQVGEQWGRKQTIASPVVVVPYNKSYISGGVTRVVRENIYILPQDLKVVATVEPELRSRGIFSVPVYKSRITLTGNFQAPVVSTLGIPASALVWNEATLVLGLSDARSLNIIEGSTLGSQVLTFSPGSPDWTASEASVSARILAPMYQNVPFAISFEMAGSKSLSFLPLGETTQVNISAPWRAPSFVGAYLPDSEELGKDTFSATWHISALGRSYPGLFAGTLDKHLSSMRSSAFGVNLFREVTFYTLVSRTVKYAILFIALTFLAFYLFEIMSGTRVHPFQYLLIGASLVLFYLLLLSFSEHIVFALAYLLSSILTLGLVTTYSASVLKANKRAWIIAAILAVLYAYLYAILQLEQFALLFGTLFLFVALAVVMRATRKIEWYREVE